MVAGLEVPHAHLHLVPINGIGDLSFANAAPESNDNLTVMAEKIKNQLEITWKPTQTQYNKFVYIFYDFETSDKRLFRANIIVLFCVG